MEDKLHIHIIDGVEAWIPVEVVELNENEFEIKEFEDFDPTDTSLIPQFIPGDIVTRKLTEGKEGKFWSAEKLIYPSNNAEKKYFEFLYKIVTGNKLRNDNERFEYQKIIARIGNEINEGKFHYPTIIDYIKGIGAI